jgi:hypothetical protein
MLVSICSLGHSVRIFFCHGEQIWAFHVGQVSVVPQCFNRFSTVWWLMNSTQDSGLMMSVIESAVLLRLYLNTIKWPQSLHLFSAICTNICTCTNVSSWKGSPIPVWEANKMFNHIVVHLESGGVGITNPVQHMNNSFEPIFIKCLRVEMLI